MYDKILSRWTENTVSCQYLNQVIRLPQQLGQFFSAAAPVHLIHIFSECHKSSVGFLSLNPFCRSHPFLQNIIKITFLEFYLRKYKHSVCE